MLDLAKKVIIKSKGFFSHIKRELAGKKKALYILKIGQINLRVKLNMTQVLDKYLTPAFNKDKDVNEDNDRHQIEVRTAASDLEAELRLFIVANLGGLGHEIASGN